MYIIYIYIYTYMYIYIYIYIYILESSGRALRGLDSSRHPGSFLSSSLW